MAPSLRISPAIRRTPRWPIWRSAVAAYEQKNYAGAIAELKPLQGQLAPIADYVAYYLAVARVEVERFRRHGGADLAAAHRNSPLTGKSWLVEARARKAAAATDAVRLLRDHYAELPQPEGDVTLADCYQAANDLPHAAEFYQRVYYHYLTGAAASRAAAALHHAERRDGQQLSGARAPRNCCIAAIA